MNKIFVYSFTIFYQAHCNAFIGTEYMTGQSLILAKIEDSFLESFEKAASLEGRTLTTGCYIDSLPDQLKASILDFIKVQAQLNGLQILYCNISKDGKVVIDKD